MQHINHFNKGGVMLFAVILLMAIIAAVGFIYFYSTELSLRSNAVVNYNEAKQQAKRIQSIANQRLAEQQEVSETQSILLYYYNPNTDKDESGNIMCSRAGLAGIARQIPATNTPIQDAINLLIKGGLTDSEKKAGITTEFPLSGVALKGANLKDGILTLEFDDPQNKTSGGACRAGILWFQIEATAKQFPGVTEVKFIPETLFQP